MDGVPLLASAYSILGCAAHRLLNFLLFCRGDALFFMPIMEHLFVVAMLPQIIPHVNRENSCKFLDGYLTGTSLNISD